MTETYENFIEGLEAIPIICTAFSGDEIIQQQIIKIQNDIKNGR
jgi:hypothetical protein